MGDLYFPGFRHFGGFVSSRISWSFKSPAKLNIGMGGAFTIPPPDTRNDISTAVECMARLVPSMKMLKN